MNRYIHIVPRAWKDIRGILRFLNGLSPSGADSWYQAFFQTAARVAATPEAYGIADEAPHLTHAVRHAIFKTRRGRRYRIIFKFTDTELFVLRVRKPGQRPLRNRDLPQD